MRSYFSSVFIALMMIVGIEAKNRGLPPPYDSVHLLPFDGSAHFGKRQVAGLTYLFNRLDIQTVVEIGSYLGGSTRFIANKLPENGKIYAVDHWLGNANWQNEKKYRNKLDHFYEQFLSNIIHAGLTDKIVPMRMTSLEAAKILFVEPDLVFIDGAHDYESVYEDITAWYPHVEGRGVLCGDDYGWRDSKPVKRAVDQFAKENNLRVKVIQGWFWYYEPIS